MTARRRAQAPAAVLVGVGIVGAGEEDRGAIHFDVVGDGVRGDEHVGAEVLGFRAILRLKDQLEVTQAVRAGDEPAGKVHGEVLHPHGRVTARGDGPEAEGVGDPATDGSGRDTGGFEHLLGGGAEESEHVGSKQGRGRWHGSTVRKAIKPSAEDGGA